MVLFFSDEKSEDMTEQKRIDSNEQKRKGSISDVPVAEISIDSNNFKSSTLSVAKRGIAQIDIQVIRNKQAKIDMKREKKAAKTVKLADLHFAIWVDLI